MVYSRMRRRFRDVAPRDELTPSQTVVLFRLAHGQASSSDLAVAEKVRPQSMAATVAVLLDRGFVERAPDPNDRRRQLLSLTAAGRDFVDGSRRSRQEWLAGAVAERLTDAERETLLAALPLLSRLVE